MMQNEPEYLTSKQAADFLRVTVNTMSRWRASKSGPPFAMIGPRVFRYKRSELRKYLDALASKCRSDDMPPRKVVKPSPHFTPKRLKAQVSTVMRRNPSLSLGDVDRLLDRYDAVSFSDIPPNQRRTFLAELKAIAAGGAS